MFSIIKKKLKISKKKKKKNKFIVIIVIIVVIVIVVVIYVLIIVEKLAIKRFFHNNIAFRMMKRLMNQQNRFVVCEKKLRNSTKQSNEIKMSSKFFARVTIY